MFIVWVSDVFFPENDGEYSGVKHQTEAAAKTEMKDAENNDLFAACHHYYIKEV